jgi:hypothetical protein
LDLGVAVEELDEMVKVSEAVKVCLGLVPVDREVTFCKEAQGLFEDLLVSHDSNGGLLEIISSWLDTSEVNGTVHLGQVETPVGNADNRDFWIFEELVEDLERKMGRLFSKTDFIEKDNSTHVATDTLGFDGKLKDLFDSLGRGEGRALVREDVDGGEVSDEGVGGTFSLEVGGDQFDGEGLGASWLSDDKDGDPVEDADDHEEEVLTKRLVEGDSFSTVDVLNPEHFLLFDEVVDSLHSLSLEAKLSWGLGLEDAQDVSDVILSLVAET